jgi:DNA polymerase III delta subunit
MNKIKPPIFFKNIPTVTQQCKLWSLEKVNTTQKKLIKLEINCKSSTYPEKTLISQFILSTSLLAIKK